MDLIQWLESHLGILGAFVGMVATGFGIYLAIDRRQGKSETNQESILRELDRHAAQSRTGFDSVHRQLQVFGNDLVRHEREIGRLDGRVTALERESE